MDKHSPKISVKLNGSEVIYAEKRMAVVSRRDDSAVLSSAPVKKSAHTPGISKSVKKRIALTIGSAVILGTGLGIAVLQMAGNNEMERVQPAAITAGQQKPASQPKDNNITLQPLQLFVIQGGSFSTREKGQAAIEELKKKDIPAAMREMDGKFFVLTAVSSDAAAAKQIIESRNKEGVSSYLKQWSFVQKDVSKSFEGQKSIIAKAENLLASIEKQSTLGYMNGNVDETEWSRIKNERETIVKEGKGVEQEEVKKLLSYTLLAYDALGEYKTKKDSETFVKLQQTLLSGLTAYEQIVTAK